jgi:hypothetical protein
MGTQIIGNPSAEESESAEPGNTYLQVVNGDTVSLPIGTVVSIVSGYAGSGSFTVKRTPTTADFLILGVVSGAAIPVGGAGRVTTEGLAIVTFDGNTTAGHLCLSSATTAGEGLDSATATLGKTVGTILNTQSGGAGSSAYVHVHKM